MGQAASAWYVLLGKWFIMVITMSQGWNGDLYIYIYMKSTINMDEIYYIYTLIWMKFAVLSAGSLKFIGSGLQDQTLPICCVWLFLLLALNINFAIKNILLNFEGCCQLKSAFKCMYMCVYIQYIYIYIYIHTYCGANIEGCIENENRYRGYVGHWN